MCTIRDEGVKLRKKLHSLSGPRRLRPCIQYGPLVARKSATSSFRIPGSRRRGAKIEKSQAHDRDRVLGRTQSIHCVHVEKRTSRLARFGEHTLFRPVSATPAAALCRICISGEVSLEEDRVDRASNLKKIHTFAQ